MFRLRPLLPLAGGFLLGIALARTWTPFLLLPALAALPFVARRHPAALLIAGLGLGGLRQSLPGREEAPTAPELPLIGVVDGPPHVYRSLEDLPGSVEEDGAFRVGDVQVRYFRRPPPGLVGGERVRVSGRLKRPEPPRNPGEFDRAAHLHRLGIRWTLSLERLEILEGPPVASRVRAWFRERFDRHLDRDTGAFLSSIVLGRREALDDALRLNLQESGTAHLLAISGQNLVIVLGALWTLLMLAGLRGRRLSGALLALLAGYALLTGLQVSVLRSLLMVGAYFGADFAWRRRDPLSATALAALLICAWDPGQVEDVGFQLSFSAVLGLSLVGPAMHGCLPGRSSSWTIPLRGAVIVSAAAWLATAPIVLSTFNLLTPGIIPANLVLGPLISLEFVLGLAHLGLEPLGLGALSGLAADLVFSGIRRASALVNAIPLSHAYAPSLPAWGIAAYYALLGAWLGGARRAPRPAWILALAVPVTLLGLSGRLARKPMETPLLAVLDVGRGSCAYLEWPDGRNLMVDCGSLNRRDVGAGIAAPYLWSRGITRLDTLVLTHPDADHVNGAEALFRLVDVRRVLLTRAFGAWAPPPGVERLVVERETAEPLRLGELEILGPPRLERLGLSPPSNETSIVLRAAGVLFPGDVEERGVEALFGLPEIRADVLILPHHGKLYRQHEEFVRRVDPEEIVVSGPEGYASEKVLQALPLPPRITGREGAILIPLKSR
jgi:competence protein ComEC